MGKKSGTAVSAQSPEAPDAAQEPDVADPGEASETEAEQSQTQQLEPGSTKLERPSGSEQSESETEETHWVGLKLKDDQGNPVPGEPFRLKLPDGTVVEGKLDAKGKVEIRGVPAGKCQVCFPKIDSEDWRPV